MIKKLIHRLRYLFIIPLIGLSFLFVASAQTIGLNLDQDTGLVGTNGTGQNLDSDGITSNGLFNVTNPATAGTWEYTTAGGTNTFTGSGTTFRLTTDGDYKVGVRNDDTESWTYYSPDIKLDTTPPPVLKMDIVGQHGVYVGSREDSVRVNNWEYTLNGGSTWIPKDNTSGSHTPTAQAYTANQLGVRQIDRAGNVSEPSLYPEPITIITTLTLGIREDTGFSRADNITSDTRVWILNKASGATYRTTTTGSTGFADNSGNITLAANTSYAADTIGVEQTLSGVTTTVFIPSAVEVDTTAPANVTFGTIGSDGIITPTANIVEQVTGTIWQVSTNAGDSSPTWTDIPYDTTTFTLPVGTYAIGAIGVRQIDDAGNISATVQTNGAEVTVTAALSLRLTEDTGSSSSDFNTKNRQITVSNITTGATWQYTTNGHQATPTWEEGGTETTTTFDLPVTSGSATFVANQIGVREGTAGTPVYITKAVVIDNTAPSTPSDLALDGDTNISDDWVTSNATVDMSATLTTTTGFTWEYTTDTTATPVVWTPGTGTSFTLAEGTYPINTIGVRQTDVAGNVSSIGRNSSSAITIDATAPAQVAFTVSATGLIKPTNIETTTGIIWQYSTNAGGGTPTWTNASGTTHRLPSGDYAAGAIGVRQIDLAGNESTAATRSTQLTVTAPTVNLALTEDTGALSTDFITNNTGVTVSGFSTGATAWEYTLNGNAVAPATPTWTTVTGTTTTTFALTAGTTYPPNSIGVREVISGTVSNDEIFITTEVVVDTTAPADVVFTITDGVITPTNLETATGTVWQVLSDDGITTPAWTDASGTTFSLSPGDYGIGDIGVRQIDVAGNESTLASNTATVTVEGLYLRLTMDTGVQNNDFITSNDEITISGLTSGATSWQYTLDGNEATPTWTTITDTTTTTFDLAATSYNSGDVGITETVSGTTSDAVYITSAITIDKSDPAAISFTINDNGTDTTDGVTTDRTATLVTTNLETATGTTWQYTLNASLSPTQWTTGSGTTFTIPPGTYAASRIGVRQVDVAGNQSDATTHSSELTVVGLGLALTEDTGASDSDFITSNSEITISNLDGTATSWEYTLNGNAITPTWETGTGTTFDLTATGYNPSDVGVREIISGTASNEISITSQIVIDKSDPAKVTFTITNGVITPTNLETASGTVWQVSTNAGEPSPTWRDVSTTTYNIPSGTHAIGTIGVRQIDVAGNDSAPATNSAVVTVEGVSLSLTDDTGSLATDFITMDDEITVSGLESGINWEYTLDGNEATPTWTEVTNTTASPVTTFDLTATGYNSGDVGVRQTVNGTTFEDFITSAIVIDTAAPSAPDISITDEGSSNSDGITNDNSFTITLETTDATWEYTTNATDTSPTYTPGSGTSLTLDDGDYAASTIAFRQTDVAGNTSTSTTHATALTIDTDVPSAPTISIDDTGSSDSDGITNDDSVDVSGIETGATWEYSTDGKAATPTFTAGTTSNSFTLTAATTYAVDTIIVKQTDVAGNTATYTHNEALTIDTANPATISFTINDNGTDTTDGITDDGRATLVDTNLETATGTVWEYTFNAGATTPTWVTGAGTNFRIPSNATAYAADTIGIRQIDTAGNASTPTTHDAALTVTRSLGIELNEDTGTSATDFITSNGEVAVIELASGATWEYTVDGNAVAPATPTWTTGSGTTFTVPEGTYAASAIGIRETLSGGAAPSASIYITSAITIDTTAPDVPTVSIDDTGLLDDDGITSATSVSVSGIETGLSWEYTTDATSTPPTWTTGTGTSFTLTAGTTYPVNTIAVRQTDVAGNTSTYTRDTTLTIDTTAPTTVSVTGTDSAGGNFDSSIKYGHPYTLDGRTYSGTGPTGLGKVSVILELTDGTKVVEKVATSSDASAESAVAANGNWSVRLTGDDFKAFRDSTTVRTETTYGNIYFIAEDKAGNIQTGSKVAVVGDMYAPVTESFSSTIAPGTYSAGSTIEVVIEFDEPVTLFSTLVVTLETGENDGTCEIETIDNSDTTTCGYRVRATDNTTNLEVKSLHLKDEGDRLLDAFGNDVLLATLPTETALVAEGTTIAITPTNSRPSGGSRFVCKRIDVSAPLVEENRLSFKLTSIQQGSEWLKEGTIGGLVGSLLDVRWKGEKLGGFRVENKGNNEVEVSVENSEVKAGDSIDIRVTNRLGGRNSGQCTHNTYLQVGGEIEESSEDIGSIPTIPTIPRETIEIEETETEDSETLVDEKDVSLASCEKTVFTRYPERRGNGVASGLFGDASSDHESYEALIDLGEQGLVSGDDNTGNARLDDKISRAEIAKIISVAREDEVLSGGCGEESEFSDASLGDWFHDYVLNIQEEGIIEGYPDGTFGPTSFINKVEFYKILAGAFGYEPRTSNADSNWYDGYVRRIEGLDIVPERIANLEAGATLSRGQVFTLLSNMLKKIDG